MYKCVGEKNETQCDYHYTLPHEEIQVRRPHQYPTGIKARGSTNFDYLLMRTCHYWNHENTWYKWYQQLLKIMRWSVYLI